MQGPTEVTSQSARRGLGPGLVAASRAPTARVAMGDGSRRVPDGAGCGIWGHLHFHGTIKLAPRGVKLAPGGLILGSKLLGGLKLVPGGSKLGCEVGTGGSEVGV